LKSYKVVINKFKDTENVTPYKVLFELYTTQIERKLDTEIPTPILREIHLQLNELIEIIEDFLTKKLATRTKTILIELKNKVESTQIKIEEKIKSSSNSNSSNDINGVIEAIKKLIVKKTQLLAEYEKPGDTIEKTKTMREIKIITKIIEEKKADMKKKFKVEGQDFEYKLNAAELTKKLQTNVSDLTLLETKLTELKNYKSDLETQFTMKPNSQNISPKINDITEKIVKLKEKIKPMYEKSLDLFCNIYNECRYLRSFEINGSLYGNCYIEFVKKMIC
jgi:hypothetical protein